MPSYSWTLATPTAAPASSGASSGTAGNTATAPELDFGSDVSCVPDLDPTFTLIDGPQVVAEAIVRRWSMGQGSCEDDLDAGFDARALLSRPMTRAESFRAAQKLQTEAEKDERVYSCPVQLAWSPADRSITIFGKLDCIYGTFQLTASIDKVSLQLLGIS